MPRILIVEDEADIRTMLEGHLAADGHLVASVGDGQAALSALAAQPVDLLLLDLSLPALDGLAVLRALRARGDDLPVLILTAQGSEDARVAGLDLGADDYMAKPFSVLELLARIRALLRRAKPQVNARRHLRSGPFRIDLLHKSVTCGRQEVTLGHREFKLLEILLARPGRTFSRRELLNLAWESDARPGPRTVDAHVASLRKKLGTVPCIATAEGEGYAWVEEVKALP